ncbi:MAG: hypothetical protein ACRDAM_20725, partial [Casimicrobium sp.]
MLKQFVFAITASVAITATNAATITVNSLADPGTGSTCTLRQAIESANTDTAIGVCISGAGVDTIVFDAALNLTAATPGTITLDQSSMSEAPLSGSATVNWLLTTQGGLTITGPGSTALIIDGGGLATTAIGRRILRITDNDNTNASLATISGVTFRNGRNAAGTTSVTGGCIGSSESINLTDVVFENCEAFADTANVAGGALLVGIPTATVATTLPNASLTNVRFLRNRTVRNAATSSSFDIGGAAVLGDPILKIGTVSISQTQFTGNSSSARGALIVGNATSVSMTQVQFAGNAATGRLPNAGRHGAFFINNIAGNVTLDRVDVAGNTATLERGGAGIITVGGVVNITNSAFDGNAALAGRIGGLEIATDTFDPITGNCTGTQRRDVVLINVSIRGNRALTNTGGLRIFCSENVAINDSEFVGNTIVGSPVAGSGGLSAANIFDNTSVALFNVLIAQNETNAGAVDGGFGVFGVRNTG